MFCFILTLKHNFWHQQKNATFSFEYSLLQATILLIHEFNKQSEIFLISLEQGLIPAEFEVPNYSKDISNLNLANQLYSRVSKSMQKRLESYINCTVKSNSHSRLIELCISYSSSKSIVKKKR